MRRKWLYIDVPKESHPEGSLRRWNISDDLVLGSEERKSIWRVYLSEAPSKEILETWSDAELNHGWIEERDWNADFDLARANQEFVGHWKLIFENTVKKEIGENEIFLQPGLAFGDGMHPTTRLCARLLHQSVKTRKPRSILDLGCGTGVLGIFARKLGVPEVYSLDVDAHATHQASLNFEKNHLDANIVRGSINSISTKFELILGNLFLGIHLALSDEYLNKVTDHGELVLSGYLQKNEDELHAHFQEAFSLLHCERDTGWSASLWRKRP